jgi:FlaA1/EpsC-like NDP-sugar epimerase
MSRVASKAVQVFLDMLALSAAWVGAFLLRFDWNIPGSQLQRCITLLPYVVALQYAVLHLFGVPRFAWRYVGLREVSRIFGALVVASTFLLGVRIIGTRFAGAIPVLAYIWAPMGTVAIDFILGFLGIVGLRAARRIVAERRTAQRTVVSTPATPTMLIGAGAAGLALAKEIAGHPEMGIRAVGFLDDDVTKVGTVLHGIPVIGTTADLARLCAERDAAQVLITIAGASGKQVRRLVNLCEAVNLPVKIIPGLQEIVGGHVSLSGARNVAIEDLLRREPVKLDETSISADFGGVVVVTGAGGSIGSELCRQVCRFGPRRLILIERAENALFEIHRELAASFPEIELIPAIADICDRPRIKAIFDQHRPEVVLHAAAHKHVPLMEWNAGEAVKNNVFGTKCIADISHETGVSKFVMISTDKAVNPTSVMGATKRVAELYAQALAARSKTKFVAVRFGNVLGSAGSVIPIFKEQIARGGPVTVTHPDMRRYFMTIPEASQLVLQAATMGKGGEIFILDMGEPVRIVDLAEDLIRLSGLRPGEDIEVHFTGVRPGEKLFEELSVANEAADKTFHPKIFVGRLQKIPLESIAGMLTELQKVADGGSSETVRESLTRMVPEFGRPHQDRSESAIPMSLVAVAVSES